MEKMLIVEGEMIHSVGYRPFLLIEALKRKKITNFEADNFEKDSHQKVIINMVGEEQKISEFVEFIKNNFPDYAKNCKVIEEKDSCLSEVMHINDFRDILAVEQQNNMVQGGLLIGNKIDNLIIGQENLRTETNENFGKMDVKYEAISDGMFCLAEAINKRLEKLEERNEIVDTRMEKTEKNIEKLLETLVESRTDRS